MVFEEGKVRTLLGDDVSPEIVQVKYDEIYRHEEVWRRRTFIGQASVVLHLLQNELPDKAVFDAGCGAGKLALLMAGVAHWVDGLDFSGEAIRVARLLATLSHTENVAFIQQSIEELPEGPRYDVVTVIGTLEHVMDPSSILRKLDGILKPGGVLLVECPGFLNPRGDIYMTMLTLLGLPMSLADIRQVDYQDIEEWIKQTSLSLETVCGYAYALGWLEKGIQDIMKRVPLAIRDKGMENVDLDSDRLHWWMEKRLGANYLLIEQLEQERILLRIPVAPPIEINRSVWIGKPPSDVPPRVWNALDLYVDDDCSDDPYYCVIPPFCYYGGGIIYLLRKDRMY